MANTINTNFFGSSIDSLNSLFSSTKTNQTNEASNILGDYTSIKNGSYKKLLKSYYANEKENASENVSKESKKKVDKSVTQLAQDAKELKSAADALRTTGKKSLFVPKQVSKVNEETGLTETSEEYDYGDIFDAAEKFVNAFNDMMSSAAEISNRTIEKKMELTSSMLQKNSGLLKDIGIKIEKTGKLSIDKEKFMKADINKLKTVFNGTGSLADRLSKRSNDIYSTSEKILSTDGGTYRSNGTLTNKVKTGTRVDEEL